MIVALQDDQQKVAQPEDVHRILQAVLQSESEEDQDKEHFWVFLLQADHTIKALDLVSLGTLNQTLVHPREVFSRAITQRCAGLVLAHNHPSGNLQPSQDDIAITERLVQAGEVFGIEVLDHVITTQQGFMSFKQDELL